MNRYIQQDHLATELARMYSNETGEAFFVSVGSFPGYDIRSESGEITIELKTESTPIRTHRACIEFWNVDRDQPSGVLATKSNLWLHIVFTQEGWLAVEHETDRLRKLVVEEGTVGRNANSLFKLIDLDIFTRAAKRVFPIESEFLTCNNSVQEGSLRRGGTLNQATSRAET